MYKDTFLKAEWKSFTSHCWDLHRDDLASSAQAFQEGARLLSPQEIEAFEQEES